MVPKLQVLGNPVLQPSQSLQRPPLDNDTKKKGNDKEDKDKDDKSKGMKYQDASKVVNITFSGDFGFPTKRAQKLTLREIIAVKPAMPWFLRWSEVLISSERISGLASLSWEYSR